MLPIKSIFDTSVFDNRIETCLNKFVAIDEINNSISDSWNGKMHLSDISDLKDKLDELTELPRYQMQEPFIEKIDDLSQQLETMDVWTDAELINGFTSSEFINLHDLEMSHKISKIDKQCALASEINLTELTNNLTSVTAVHTEQSTTLGEAITAAKLAPNTADVMDGKLRKLGESVTK